MTIAGVFDPFLVNEELPCREDPDLFFAESPDDVEFAKSLCRTCALRVPCLAGAKARREPWGVWGGELFVSGVSFHASVPGDAPARSR